MIIQIPVDLESTIRAAVQAGRFASLDEAMTRASHLLIDELKTTPAGLPVSTEVEEPPDLLLGSMRDYADEMDEIVTEIYRQRQTDTWRDIDVE